MKKFLSLLLAMIMVLSMVGAASAESLAGTKLEIAFDLGGSQLAVFEELVADFAAETGIEATVITYGDDYENSMKTRMAANQLPDVWTTHGWSLLRYSEYLMPLNDQPWVDEMTDLATGVITNAEGNLYVLDINAQINATLTNLKVCEAAGVDPYAIRTWDDFNAACAKVKEAGFMPLGNGRAAGNLANIAPSWIAYDGALMNCEEALLDGSFDWNNFMPELKVWQGWLEAGYCYEDLATISGDDINERWATDQAAFYLGVNTNFPINMLKLNPEANYIYIPTPASTPEGMMGAAVGEGNAFGIWKDTKNEAGAKAFLAFMARTENALKLTGATGFIAALKGTQEAANAQYAQGLINNMMEKFDNVAYENFFDRKYLPSGMWGVMAKSFEMLATDYSDDGLAAIVEYIDENFDELYEIAHEK